MRHRFAGVVLVALLAGGCAAGTAFRKGQEAARVSDWDAAVTYYTKAVQEDPDSAEYKIHLQRAQEEASRTHIEKAQQLEKKDQLDGALAEYRRALQLDSSNRTAVAKVAELEQTIRDRLEASRPKPKILELQQQAQRLSQPPLLNPASRDPLRVSFNNSSLRDILNVIGATTGINVTYDQQFVDKPYTVNLDGVTIEEALQQILSANGYYYKVVNPRTIIIIPDQPAKHTQYDELVVRVFYISHADATELAQIVNTIMRIPQLPLPPMVMPNKAANTITVRATAPVVEVIDRIIRANDKPRAEVVLDVEILEVDRERIKRYGINLSQYNLNILFSPEVAPPNTGRRRRDRAAAVQPEHDQPGHQHRGLLSGRADGGGELPRDRQPQPHAGEAAAPWHRRPEDDPQSGSGRAGDLDGVRRRCRRGLCDDSAVVVHLPAHRREHGNHAARHV